MCEEDTNNVNIYIQKYDQSPHTHVQPGQGSITSKFVMNVFPTVEYQAAMDQ